LVGSDDDDESRGEVE